MLYVANHPRRGSGREADSHELSGEVRDPVVEKTHIMHTRKEGKS
jgi:hypothetical protein